MVMPKIFSSCNLYNTKTVRVQQNFSTGKILYFFFSSVQDGEISLQNTFTRPSSSLAG